MEISKFKVAGVQMDIHLADADRNLDVMHQRLREATSADAQLTVFPECTTTGYCFESLAEARTVAQPLEGENFERVHQMCFELNTLVVFGFLELSINRIGCERGIEFIGKSKICDPNGKSLAFANHANEEILYAEIDPQFARQKHLVNTPGVHEVHRLQDRRPDVYGPLLKPVSGSKQP